MRGKRARGRGPGNGVAERQGCGPTGSRKAATGLDECRQPPIAPHDSGRTPVEAGPVENAIRDDSCYLARNHVKTCDRDA